MKKATPKIIFAKRSGGHAVRVTALAAAVMFAAFGAFAGLASSAPGGSQKTESAGKTQSKSSSADMTSKPADFNAEAETYKKLAGASERLAEANTALKKASDERKSLLSGISSTRPQSPSPVYLRAEAENFRELATAAQKCAAAAERMEALKKSDDTMEKAKANSELQSAVERKKALVKTLR
jgi:multidrug efflux pump subunit AcrB